MKQLIVIFLILLTFGCHGIKRGNPMLLYKRASVSGLPIHQCSLPTTYVINKYVPKNIKKIIRRSADYWNGLSDRTIFLYAGLTDWVPNDMRSGVIIVIGMTKFRPLGHEDMLAIVDRTWTLDGCLVRSGMEIHEDVLEIPDSQLESIIRHEFGHLLGLKHSPHYGDLMYSISDPENGLEDLNDWELKAFDLIYNPSKFNE